MRLFRMRMSRSGTSTRERQNPPKQTAMACTASSFLSPSQYTLTVVHDRFRKESRSITVLLETPVTVNITLEIAKTNTQLFVTAEAPLVQADNGDVSITMSQEQISELPNPGNDLTYIAQTAPGAIMATDNARTGGGGGNFSILGMPGPQIFSP